MSKPKFVDRDACRCVQVPDNMGITCEKVVSRGCEHCGWNPKVSKERRRRLAEDLDALQRKEPIPVHDLYDEDGNEIVEVRDDETDN